MASKTSAASKGGKGGSDHRSAKSGRFVTKKYADSHPDTTVKETRKS